MISPSKGQKEKGAVLSPLETLKSGHGLFWIMVKSKHQKVVSRNEGHPLRTCTIFHTTEYAEIPESAIELLSSLLRSLRAVWTQNHTRLQDRLMEMVSEA